MNIAGSWMMSETTTHPDQPYVYDAFISYGHVERDRKWAECLIEALESYQMPKSLQAKGLPARFRKVFRDEDEVPASSDLNDQIEQALVGSRFLIVVCSATTPVAVKSSVPSLASMACRR
jgi:hypothetical protein